MYKLAIAAFTLIAASSAAIPTASAQVMDRDFVGGGPRAQLTDVGQIRNPDTFAARSRQQMDRLRHHAEDEVARGRLSPQVLRNIAHQRNVVENLLSHAGADGKIGRRERRAVSSRLYQMREVAYGAVPPSGYGYGGGPTLRVMP